MINPATMSQRDFLDANTLRLISTAYITEAALAPLADDAAELDFLAELEGLTSGAKNTIVNLPAGVSPEELLTPVHGFGWTYINAAFCYTRAAGNRFNGPERGVWYGSYGADAEGTARAEVHFHLSRELGYAGNYDNVTSYRELRAGFATCFHDLHGCDNAEELLADVQRAYPAGQALARTLLQQGSNGLLYPSARHADGHCLAAFRPQLIQNLRYGDTWRFTWSGSAEARIEKL